MNINKKTRTLSTVSAFTIAGLLLTGCGSNADSNDNTDISTSDTTTKPLVVVPEIPKTQAEIDAEIEAQRVKYYVGQFITANPNFTLSKIIIDVWHKALTYSDQDSGYISETTNEELFPAGSPVWCVQFDVIWNRDEMREDKFYFDRHIDTANAYPTVDLSPLYWKHTKIPLIENEEITAECGVAANLPTKSEDVLPPQGTQWEPYKKYSFVKAFYAPPYDSEYFGSYSLGGNPIIPRYSTGITDVDKYIFGQEKSIHLKSVFYEENLPEDFTPTDQPSQYTD